MITRGSVTIKLMLDNCFCASLGEDVKDPETEIIIYCLHVDYIDDLIATLNAFKEELK